jgi:hypothetical protein
MRYGDYRDDVAGVQHAKEPTEKMKEMVTDMAYMIRENDRR